jgi:hypothetical protein
VPTESAARAAPWGRLETVQEVSQGPGGIHRHCDHEPVSADDDPGQQWLAIGLDLTLVPTAEGGRKTPVLFTEPLRYRPNWGLPGMTGTDQTGAPVLCSSTGTLAPGDSARAVIIPLTDWHMTEWRLLNEGDTLRMFEGPRICGHAVVRWSENTSRPIPGTDKNRFSAWANSSDDRPRPT